VAASVPRRNRELVADEFAATAGENGRATIETCPLLLAVLLGELFDERVIWEYSPADRRAFASGGIAEGVGNREIDPESKGEGRVSGKSLREGRGQKLRDSG